MGEAWEWKDGSKGVLPQGALEAGYDGENAETETVPLYIGSAWYNDQFLAGSVDLRHKCCYIAKDGKVLRVSDFTVLCDVQNTVWEPHDQRGNPFYYFNGLFGWDPYKQDEEEKDEEYTDIESPKKFVFIARKKHMNSLIVGYYSEIDELMHFAFDGKEVTSTDCELLRGD